MNPSFAASVAFWLRAYPRRWRAARADEVAAVLADLAGPHAQRLDRRTAWGLLRGGWAARWRGHPPLHTYVSYRFGNARVPERYRAWVQDDILGGGYPAWEMARSGLGVYVSALVNPWLLAWYAAASVVVLALSDRTATRERALRRQLEPRWGDTGVPEVLVLHAARERWAAPAVLAGCAAIALTATATWTIVARHEVAGAWIAVAVGLGSGLLMGVWCALELRRYRAPRQPDRVLVAGRRRMTRWAIACCLVVVLLGVLEARGGWITGFALVAAPLSAVCLPAVLVGWVWSVRHGRTLAAVDVVRAMGGADPRVDTPQVFRRVGGLQTLHPVSERGLAPWSA